MSKPRTNIRHPQPSIRCGVLGTSRDDPPGLAGLGAGLGDPLDGVEALGVLEVAGDAQDLADVGRADEEQVDVGDRRRSRRPTAIAPAVSIWMPTKVSALALATYSGSGHQAEPAVAVAAVHPSLAPGVELRPADGLLGVLGRLGPC